MATSFREIARGIGFTEGPVWLGEGRLAVTSMSRGQIVTLALDGTPDTSVERIVETGGGPNGLALGRDGRLAVLQNAKFRTRSLRPVSAGIQVVDGDVVTDLVTPASVAPNDGTYGPDGALWYTDPGTDEERGLAPRVRRWDPATDDVTTVAEGIAFPNGLAFDADASALFVADSHGDRIVRLPREGATLGDAETFAEIPGTEPDGIAFDAGGNLYVAAFASDEVVVIDPTGSVTDRLPTGEGSRPTNLCFAGDDLRTLVVTLASGGRVVAVDDLADGLPL
ncbi:SMP-30/gluconolactonase/LRE family protein [Microbacterium sp.]|uniref:SMP-30/gluconolactonase/LRE family protein n=1 Tax=Microbacterium sp. TaxID=51671 RepID=UPI002D785E3C|nr:SMP-30/gluconolactonase/LRE family protein [Microbacterium sp.]HET6299978.1 SMP-30/gluconolactonase/LRE family protein [Microbacterium sp.]